MRIAGWNMRGFTQSGRRTQLTEYIRKESIDAIFLQETIRQDFTDQELRKLVNGEIFTGIGNQQKGDLGDAHGSERGNL
jgi:exonuclease III